MFALLTVPCSLGGLGIAANVLLMLTICCRRSFRRLYLTVGYSVVAAQLTARCSWSYGLLFHQGCVDLARSAILLPLGNSIAACRAMTKCSLVETTFLLLVTVSTVSSHNITFTWFRERFYAMELSIIDCENIVHSITEYLAQTALNRRGFQTSFNSKKEGEGARLQCIQQNPPQESVMAWPGWLGGPRKILGEDLAEYIVAYFPGKTIFWDPCSQLMSKVSFKHQMLFPPETFSLLPPD